MPIIQTEQNPISGQEYLDAGSTRELVGQLKGYAEGYSDCYNELGGGGGSANSVTFYAWANNGESPWFTLSEHPDIGDTVYLPTDSGYKTLASDTDYTVSAVGEGTISVVDSNDSSNYSNAIPRMSSNDMTFTK